MLFTHRLADFDNALPSINFIAAQFPQSGLTTAQAHRIFDPLVPNEKYQDFITLFTSVVDFDRRRWRSPAEDPPNRVSIRRLLPR